MSTWIRQARWSALGLIVATALVAGGAAQAASAETTPAPAPPSTTSNPSLESQNDARNHVLGATTGESSAATGNSKTPQTFSAPQAAANSVLGMDVSGYQPNVDWNAAVSDGAKFV